MTNHARTGGILSIISGVFSVFYILGLAALGLAFSLMPTTKGSPNFPSEILWIIVTVLCIIALLFALLGALAITGGTFAIKHKHWGWALAGAIVSEWLLYPCGVTAVIMISLAKQEFAPIALNTGAEESSSDSTTLPAAATEQNKARTAGILAVIAGIMGVFNLGLASINIAMMNMLSNSNSPFSKPYGSPFTAEYLKFQNNYSLIWGIVSAVFGTLSIVGGIIALKKKNWRWAMAGSIAGILAFWPCGIPGTILMSMAKEEFNKSAINTTTI